MSEQNRHDGIGAGDTPEGPAKIDTISDGKLVRVIDFTAVFGA